MRLAFAFGFLLAATVATGAYVVPQQQDGNYIFKAQAGDQYDADGIPTTRVTASIGIVDANTGTVLGCTNVPSDVVPSPEVLITANVTAPAGGETVKVVGKAFGGADCTGDVSGPSVNFGAVFFLGPIEPTLNP